jgi:5-formyltetrahydrofolate cyclo-ligase
MATVSKRAFRKEMKALLKKVSTETIAKESSFILDRVRQNPMYQNAKKISVFLTMPGEVETSEIVRDIFLQGIAIIMEGNVALFPYVSLMSCTW